MYPPHQRNLIPTYLIRGVQRSSQGSWENVLKNYDSTQACLPLLVGVVGVEGQSDGAALRLRMMGGKITLVGMPNMSTMKGIEGGGGPLLKSSWRLIKIQYTWLL